VCIRICISPFFASQGITLSEQQLALATQRVRDAGVAHLVTFHLVDYRVHAPEGGVPYDRCAHKPHSQHTLMGTHCARICSFSRHSFRFFFPLSCRSIISCEMLEAVGHEYLGEYFAHCSRLLAPNGVLVVQVITTPECRYEAYRSSTDFIKEYIFPGCCCPSLTAVLAAAGERGGFTLAALEEIGPHYAPTLLRWRDAFLANAPQLAALGFGPAFIRCWDYYFCYCAAGFATRTLGDVQLVFSAPGNVAALGNVRYETEPRGGPAPNKWW
jgi:cyclopropane fatty-acyl-phospholipid synthase-like methyltransferase